MDSLHGPFLVCLAFISALFALTAFILNRKTISDSWKKYCIGCFNPSDQHIFNNRAHLFMMSQHYYEYNYV